MSLIIPLVATPAQSISVQLAGQNCQITVRQFSTGLFLDLYLNTTLLIGGVLCENLNRIVRNTYFGFIGDLCFLDTQGAQDPDYTGLGGRYLLAYLTPTDLGGQG
jgi:hypothetical protein